jgi:transketolase
MAIERLVSTLPERVGGSADLTGSNLTNWPGCQGSLHRMPGGNYISYGVREFGMSHIMNGMALHGGIFPFGGTFLMFSEYARNALRMSALMKQRVVYVFTHDSIGLGEDGPTHQPVEQTATLRMIPNMTVWRPCDTTETLVAWAASVEKKDGPSCHILSRQNLPFVKRSDAQIADIRKGGYVLSDCRRRQGGADRHRFGSGTGPQGPGSPEGRGHRRPRGVHAFHQRVRQAGQGLQGQRAAAHRAQGRHRSRRHRRLVEVRGLRGAVIGLDRFGESAPAPRSVQGVRLHRRKGGQHRQGHPVGSP